MLDKAQGFDKERENWLKQNEEQAKKVNKLEEALDVSQNQVKKLEADKAGLTVD